MIDESDGDFALLASGRGSGSALGVAFGLLMVVLAVVCYVAAAQNKQECAQMTCPRGGHARLLDHACLCVDTPGPAASGSP